VHVGPFPLPIFEWAVAVVVQRVDGQALLPSQTWDHEAWIGQRRCEVRWKAE
jgi:hypothetical protein